MIKIILILALLQYVSNFIFGYKSGQLSCGIFGQATDSPERLDVNGVHILGMYNIARGKMSCGLTWDGDIQVGTGLDKLYSDFIINRTIKPEVVPIMFGHTRQPSFGGAATEEEAHPFGFGLNSNKDSYGMIFCHNGTLRNHRELALKYDIDLTVQVEKKYSNNVPGTYMSTRTKIDSEILGEILYKTKTFHVLSEYIGAAALIWTWLDEPNKIYLWSGASKTTKNSAGQVVEERPMNVYCKDDNNMFFSSLPDSLSVLGASANKDLQIDYNTVYIITDGDFKNAEKHKVSRLQAGQNEEVKTTYNNYGYDRNRYDNVDYGDIWNERPLVSKTNSSVKTKPSEIATVFTNLNDEKTIHPLATYGSRIYSKNLRYYQKEELIEGVYVYIKNWGFKKAGNTYASAISFLKSIRTHSFDFGTGMFVHNANDKNKYIPYSEDTESIQLHYFIDGVMVKTVADFNKANQIKLLIYTPGKRVPFGTLSYMTKHPIIDLNSKTGVTHVFLDNNVVTGSFCELGFERIYQFNQGKLVRLSPRQDISFESKEVTVKEPKQVVINLPAVTARVEDHDAEVLKSSIKNIELFEDDLKAKKDLESENVKNENHEIFIKDLILDSFGRHSEDLSETIIEFSDFKDDEMIKLALETLNLVAHTIKDFITIPNK